MNLKSSISDEGSIHHIIENSKLSYLQNKLPYLQGFDMNVGLNKKMVI
jgi:hypothetical protein